MKVALVSSNYATTPYPVYPLGMSVVARSLEAAGHEPVMIDLLASDSSVDVCLEQLKAQQPQLVGISLRNIDNTNLLNEVRFVDVVEQIVAMIHEQLNVPVILGGSGYSLLPERILDTTRADYGIVGEGESLMVELVDAIESAQAPPKGTILRSDNHLDGAGISGASYDPSIVAHYHKMGGIAAIQTKRGCSLRCSYCSYPSLEGNAIRVRPAQDVADDIERLTGEHEIRHIFFADSVFNDVKGRYLEVLHEMKRRNLSPPWSTFIKPSGLTSDIVELMKETGMVAAELGSDAACDVTLRGLRKPFKWTHVVEANDMLMAQNISVAHYFIFGGPGENRQTVLEGIQNILKLNCTAAFVYMGIRILPHTAIHQRAIDEGIIKQDYDLLTPAYYLSPEVSRPWMEETLTEAFKPHRHILFPPDVMDDRIQMLHQMGFAGSLWELLNPAV